MPTLIELIEQYEYFGWLAFVLTVFLTPVAIQLAQRLGVMDMPDQLLKPHARPVPYLGGAAICAGWAAAVALAVAVGRVQAALVLPILLGGVAMSVMGLVDDARQIAPKVRLLIGTAVIAGVLISTGTGFNLVFSLTQPLGLEVPRALSVPISILLGVFLVLGACNSTNLIDGLDGLCTGVTALISLGFFLLASHLAAWGYSEVGDPARLVLSLAMFGATLGFLPWNFRPAKIFMGDAGSVLLGFNCGMIILLFAEKGIVRWVIGALMIFALPIYDTALAMYRRWRSGRSIFEGDRSHFYDQLVQRGFSVSQTVLICYGLTVVYGVIGLLLTWVHQGQPVIRTRYAIPLFIAVWALTAAVSWLAGLTNPEQRGRSERSPASAASGAAAARAGSTSAD